MRLLLDTQSAYWWLLEHRRLSRKAKAAIGHPRNHARASIISVYEMGIKVRRGLLSDDVAQDFATTLVATGLDPIPLTIAHMERGALLGWRNNDPWDRLYAAQAMVEGMTLVSSDEAFDELPIRRLW
ncbi:MAG: type II toxin-antitoxin system VapC family toxin [Alphaproteobacteria bacterium]